MSTDHRKPVVAFVVLAFIAAALVGMQRADALNGRFFAAFVGSTGQAHGRSVLAAEGALSLDRPRALSADGLFDTPDSTAEVPTRTPSGHESSGNGLDHARHDSDRATRGRSARRPLLRSADKATNGRHLGDSGRHGRPDWSARGHQVSGAKGHRVADVVHDDGRRGLGLRAALRRELGTLRRGFRDLAPGQLRRDPRHRTHGHSAEARPGQRRGQH